MNEEIRAAMRQTYQEMGEAMLKDERRMASFLADILGNRYPGERLLLRQLMQTGLPRMIAEGGATVENLGQKAAYVAEKYLWREDATLAAARVWFETLKGVTLPPEQPKQPEPAKTLPKAQEQALAQSAQPKPPPAPSRPHIPTPPATRKLPTYTNSIGMEFVLIPAGTFLMGSPDDDEDAYPDEKPQHKVTISRPFYLGKYPVTHAQWEAVTGHSLHKHKFGCWLQNYPVDGVSWNDVQNFIVKLNATESHNRYRLPTEAEWEYTCRAGSTGKFSFGDDEGRLDEYAWYFGNSGGETLPVGQKKPNDWGLCDMHGNVWEWCSDWYGKNYYRGGSVVDPQGPSAGEGRVLRGGGWLNPAGYCRAAARGRVRPDHRIRSFGFRLALSLEE